MKITKSLLWAVGLGFLVQPALITKTDASIWSSISGLYGKAKEKMTSWGADIEAAVKKFGHKSLMLDYNSILVQEYQKKYNAQTAKKGDDFVAAMNVHKKAHDALHLSLIAQHEANVAGDSAAKAVGSEEKDKHAYNKENHDAAKAGHLKDVTDLTASFAALQKKWEEHYKDKFPDPHGFYTATENSTVVKK